MGAPGYVESHYPINKRFAPPRPKTLNTCCGTKCALLNSRSINNKEHLIFELIVDFDLDLLALTETWCHNNSIVSLNLITPPGYSVTHTPRGTKGGGVGLVHRDNYRVKLDRSKKFTSFEHQVVSVTFGTESLKVVIFYKPTGLYDETFHIELNECLTNLFSRGNFKPLFLGDFNFHVDDLSNPHANKFKDTLQLFGLTQHVNLPTHTAGHTLDLVITRNNLDVHNIKTEASIVSDHDAVLFDLSSPRPVPPLTTVYYRKWHQAYIPSLVNDLQLCF
jgi:hypothetical protein